MSVFYERPDACYTTRSKARAISSFAYVREPYVRERSATIVRREQWREWRLSTAAKPPRLRKITAANFAIGVAHARTQSSALTASVAPAERRVEASSCDAILPDDSLNVPARNDVALDGIVNRR